MPFRCTVWSQGIEREREGGGGREGEGIEREREGEGVGEVADCRSGAQMNMNAQLAVV